MRRAIRFAVLGIAVAAGLVGALLTDRGGGVSACAPTYDPGTAPPYAYAKCSGDSATWVGQIRVPVGATVYFKATTQTGGGLPTNDFDTVNGVNTDQGANTFRCNWDLNGDGTAETNATTQAVVSHVYQTAGTFTVSVATDDTATVKNDNAVGGGSVTVTVGLPTWYPDTPITPGAISSPSAGLGYACNSDVTCTISPASDTDKRVDPVSGVTTYEDDECTYTWSASAGSFPDGATGMQVKWRAPNSPSPAVTITCKIDDKPLTIPPGEAGSRNDEYVERSVEVKVYTVACIRVDATYDLDIYWPNEPHTSDKIWAADPDVFQSSGQVQEMPWERRYISDAFPPQQSYHLVCSLARYPACETTQSVTTTASLLNSSEDITGWLPHIVVLNRTSVGSRQYTVGFTFAVEGRQVGETQTVPQSGNIMDYAVYGAHTSSCPEDQYTQPHLADATTWGEGQSDEAGIANAILYAVNPLITSTCCCPSTFAWHWNAAKRLYNDGMCCCRAMGMSVVMQLLGVEDYTTICRVCEEPEPHTEYAVASTTCATCGSVQRKYRDGMVYYVWEGVCRSHGDGSLCYGPAGIGGTRVVGTYAQVRAALGTFYWVNDYNVVCTHLPPP